MSSPIIASHTPENIKVELAVGSIGSRGTDVEAKVALDGSGCVKVFSGEVEIIEERNEDLLLVNTRHLHLP